MNRSDFLSAMAAVFCGVVLPEPVRETIRIATDEELIFFTEMYWRDSNGTIFMTNSLKANTWEVVSDFPFQTTHAPWGRIVGINRELGETTLDTPLRLGPNNGIIEGVAE